MNNSIMQMSQMLPIYVESPKFKIFSEKLKCDAMLIVSPVNRLYLTGFHSTAGAVLVTKDKSFFLTDFRYFEAASKVIKGCEVVEYSSMFKTLATIFEKYDLKTILIEQQETTLLQWEKYKKYFENTTFIGDNTLDQILSNLRQIKSVFEIEKIAKAQEITEKAYNEVLNFIKPGVTELEIAFNLEMNMKKLGAQRVAFDLITIAGEKTSLPHGEPSNNIVKEGDFVTMDIGAVFEGLHSDMTRTVGVGHLSDKQIEVYNIVHKAQLTGLSAIKAGMVCSDIDKAARDVIENAGYGKYFGHSLGHAVGFEIHENPRFSPTCDEITKEGMVITVEPGIYLPNEFGVRIEDMVAITEQGYNNFTNISKELLIL